MAKSFKKCRVCGKEYEACHTDVVDVGGFRWQDVACSKECGDIYFKQILESRMAKPEATTNVSEEASWKIIP